MHHVHRLVFCKSSQRWHAYEGNNYCCPIHCGDPICIRVKDRYFEARVEMDSQWYVLIAGEKFWMHPKQKYDAILLF
jgi:hypothetical protein